MAANEGARMVVTRNHIASADRLSRLAGIWPIAIRRAEASSQRRAGTIRITASAKAPLSMAMLRELATSTKDEKLALRKSWRRDISRGRFRFRSIQKLGDRTDLVRCQSFSSNRARRLAVIWSPA